MLNITEKEAQEKWCPHVVASHTNPRQGFDNDGRDKLHICIGSACMAWRWSRVNSWLETGTQDRLVTDEGGVRLVPTPPDNDWNWQPVENKNQLPGWHSWKKDNQPIKGFCGLAGAL